MSPTTPSSLSDQPSGSGTDSLNQTIQTIFSSSNSNILLAAIISLLLVILFVFILHVYAKWFLAHARRRRRRNSISVTHILGPNRLHHFHYDTSHSTNNTDNGLDASDIASIPLFVYSLYGSGEQVSPECVICLSGYEEGDIGRKLRKCGHDFHVECIDMWLRSHSSCPICRAPVVSMDEKINGGDDDDDGEIVIVIDDQDDHEQHEVGDSDSESVASAVASAACCSCSCASQSPAPATEKRMVSCKNKSERRVHPS